MRALLFDLDDTLYASSALRASRQEAIIRAVAAHLGTDIARAESAFAEAKKGKSTTEALCALGLPRSAFWDALSSVDPRPHLQPDPKLYAELLRLRMENSLAVLTNSPHAAAERVLAALGVRSLFSAVIGADDVPEPKPSSKAFEHAETVLGVARESVTMFGNSVEKDILPAMSRGMRAVRIGAPDPRIREAVPSIYHIRTLRP